MEKTLRLGAFEALDERAMMNVEGGYTFLCNDNSTPGSFKECYNFGKEVITIIKSLFF